MNRPRLNSRLVRKTLAALAGGVVLQLGVLEGCNDRLVQVSRFVDPCATFLAFCQPGDFQVLAADPGDFCVDPACTVPGQCNDDQPLGTIINVCP